MTVLDEDIGADMASAEGVAGAWPPPETRSAEARCEELRRSELDARSRAGSLKSQLVKCRGKLKAAEEETKAVRCTAKNALALQAEVTRLEKLLSEAGVESGKRSTIMSLRMEVARLRAAAPASEACRSRTAPWRSRSPEATIASLREANTVLKKDVRAAKDQTGRIKFLEREVDNHRSWLRGSHDHIERIEARHRDEIDWLNKDYCLAARGSRAVGGQAQRRDGVAAQAVRPSACGGLADGGGPGAHDRLAARTERPAAGGDRASHGHDRVASREECPAPGRGAGFGRREDGAGIARRDAGSPACEASREPGRAVEVALRQQERESRRSRTRNASAASSAARPATAAPQRPELGEKTERRNPPKDARVCCCCGKPYAANGERSTTVVEIEVKAHTRRIVRPRWRRSCDCAASPFEVTAPPVARLFDNTPYGISVWVCLLFERYACCRPLHRVSAWLADMGLAISPGTLADSVKRFVPLFEPLSKAILAHQNQAALRHVDETTWRVQALRENGRSSRAWLWTSVSDDAVYFHIDPSRSAEVAMMLFASVKGTVFLVCDRYGAYRKLARELDGKVILQWCWAHQRRSFIDCAAGHVRLTRWCQGWIERIAAIYRLNEARLEHYDPGLERQTPAFDAAQGELKEAVDELFADAEAELADLSDRALKAKPLRSLLNHREGLSVFADHPRVPPDNNKAELALRGAVTTGSLCTSLSTT